MLFFLPDPMLVDQVKGGRMTTLGAYRTPAARPTRHLDLHATVTPGGAMYLFLALGFVLAMTPFWWAPTRVDVRCQAASQACAIHVERAFGLHDAEYAVDLHGVGDVRYPTVHEKDYLEVTTDGRTSLFAAEFGNAHYLVIDTLRKFRALSDAKRVDTRGTYGLDSLPIVSFFGGLAIWLLVVGTFVAPVRIRAEKSEDRLTIEATRWPRWPHTMAFATEDVVGASSLHRVARSAKGSSNHVATIVLRTRESAGRMADLFPRSLPASPQVDEMAQRLDRFIRSGQTDE